MPCCSTRPRGGKASDINPSLVALLNMAAKTVLSEIPSVTIDAERLSEDSIEHMRELLENDFAQAGVQIVSILPSDDFQLVDSIADRINRRNNVAEPKEL